MKTTEDKAFTAYPNECVTLMSALFEANQGYFKSRMEAYQNYLSSISQVKDFSELSQKNQDYLKTFSNDFGNLYSNRTKSWQEFFNNVFSNNGMLRLIDARQNLVNPFLESFSKFTYPSK